MNSQLLLFDIHHEVSTQDKFADLESKYHNLRKSQHARISGLNKEVKELKVELEFLKSNICKQNLFV